MAHAAELFKVGDIVQLKSGGPAMTVTDVSIEYSAHALRCQWFSGKKLEQGTFDALAVERHAVPTK